MRDGFHCFGEGEVCFVGCNVESVGRMKLMELFFQNCAASCAERVDVSRRQFLLFYAVAQSKKAIKYKNLRNRCDLCDRRCPTE